MLFSKRSRPLGKNRDRTRPLLDLTDNKAPSPSERGYKTLIARARFDKYCSGVCAGTGLIDAPAIMNPKWCKRIRRVRRKNNITRRAYRLGEVREPFLWNPM